jgi:hypothetical protein
MVVSIKQSCRVIIRASIRRAIVPIIQRSCSVKPRVISDVFHVSHECYTYVQFTMFFELGKFIFVLTMIGAMLVVFLTALIQVPMLQMLLYSVPLPYQSMALGLRQTIVRVLGQTTGPLLFGFVFDQSCLVWLTDCYTRRTCKVYDNRRMGLSMALSGFSTRLISGIACGCAFLHWKFKHTDELTSAVN